MFRLGTIHHLFTLKFETFNTRRRHESFGSSTGDRLGIRSMGEYQIVARLTGRAPLFLVRTGSEGSR